MEDEIDKEEIKKCLKDANIYEENMSEHLMAEYYKAIKNSETSLVEESQKDIELAEEAEKSLNESANELLEVINQSESIAPSKRGSYIPKSDDDESLDAFGQDILNSKEANNNNNNNNSILMDNKQEKAQGNDVSTVKNAPFGFNDMPKSPKVDKDRLKIITHKLKFINIQNSKKYLVANSESRIIMLYNYHKAVSKFRAHYASLSTNMAPKGKPITTIDHDLCVNPIISTLKEEEIQLPTETYISRSGRHTKRKVYIDDDLDSPNSPTKKSKSDDDWKNSSKCSKLASKKNDCEETASTSNNNGVSRAKIKRNESPDSSQQDALTDPLENASEAPPKHRTYQRKRLTNEEIIATNPLFRDITTTKKSRASALVIAGKEEAEKKKQQEQELTKFTNSLDPESQRFDDESEKIIVDDDDFEVVEKRRVIPPLPLARKALHGRRRGGATAPEALNIYAKRPNLNISGESSDSPAVNGVGRRPQQIRRASNNNNSIDKGEPSSSSSWSARGKKDLTMTPCPLCSMSFPQKEIEEHAATCGEDVFPRAAPPKRITCDVCDAIVPFTTDYEVHVKACIAKRNGGG